MFKKIVFSLAICGVLFAQNELNFAYPRNAGPANPHLYTPNQMYAQNMIYEALVNVDENTGEILPNLALSWEIADEGKKYIFKLREDVKFSDGADFDAVAVKANIDAILDNKERHSWLELTNLIKNCEVIDKFSVALVLSKPYEPTLRELSLPRPYRFISPNSMINGSTKDGIKSPVGTGAWKLVDSKLGVSDTFEKNENYWGKRPFFDKINVSVIPDPNTKVIALKTKKIDYVYGVGEIPLDVLEGLKKDFNIEISRPVNTLAIALNSAKFPTSQLSVRKALNLALNKDEIVHSVFYDTQKRADFLFEKTLPYCDINASAYEFDLKKAAQILQDDGWILKDGVRQKDGKELKFELAYIGSNAAHKAIAEILQANLKQIGVNLELKADETTIFYKKQRTGDFGAIFNETWGIPFDPLAFMASMRAPSHADFKAQEGLKDKAQIDADITELVATFDDEKRTKLIHKLLNKFHDEAVYLPITYASIISITNKKIGGETTTKFESYVPFDKLFLK